MNPKTSNYKVLVVEDNPGDLLLIQEYLDEYFSSYNQTTTKTFEETKEVLESNYNHFDIILLDLSLPDLNGMPLLDAMVPLSGDTPLVILTGYANVPFSTLTLGQGASDYLLKDELTPFSLYKSIVHNIERKKYIQEIESSRNEYTELFQLNPQPLIIYNTDTKSIIKVNDAACDLYGYNMEEFSRLSLLDIRPKSEEVFLQQEFERVMNAGLTSKTYIGIFKHQKKNGDLFTVEVYSNPASHLNDNIRVSLINDISEKLSYIEQVEDQNKKLKDIAWIQSHVVRAPLSRIMALISLISDDEMKIDPNEERFILDKIYDSTKELDNVINNITMKASHIKESKNE